MYLENSEKSLACDKAAGHALLDGPPHANRSEVGEIKVTHEAAWMWVFRCRNCTRRAVHEQDVH